MRLNELVVEWSDVFDRSGKQRLETELLDVLKPHSDNLKKLKVVSYGGIEFPKWVGESSFCKLTTVHMYKCRNCVFLPPLGQLPSLKKLSIESMNDVKEVSSEFLGNGDAAFPSLEILRFNNMPQWEVWSVNVSVFTAFPCLKELHIQYCPRMARWEVWSTNVGVTVFPCLQELVVRRCPKLVKVSLEALPSLRDLEISKCGDGVLKSLVGVASLVNKLSISGIPGLSDEVWGGVVQYLGAVEELSFWGCKQIRNLWESKEGETCKEILVNLKTLYINRCEKLVRIGGEKEVEEEEGGNLPTSLRMLTICDCKNLQYLSCPKSIETLEIDGCDDLEHLSCPTNNIQKLRISDCRSVTYVSFPTEGGGGGWQKLESLDIRECNSELEKELEKQTLIIFNNTTTTMPILEVLRIRNWENLNSLTKFTTCFIRLIKLELGYCGKIESFPDLQDLVSLKDLTICDCPSMDGPPLPLRSSGVSAVWPPKLDSLSIGKLKRPISEWGPLPTSLVDLNLWGGFGSSSSAEEKEEDVKSFPTSSLLIPYSLSSSLTSLKLWDFKKMERLSLEGLQRLTSLQHLSIEDCPKLKDLPETLLPSLLSLEIVNCPNEELKEKIMSRRGSYWPLLSHIPRVYIL